MTYRGRVSGPMLPRLSLSLLVFGLMLSQSFAQSGPEFEDLFDGRSFAGWTCWVREKGVSDPSGFFALEDGLIRTYPGAEAGSDQPFAGLITEALFSDYHLTLEYKWGEKKFGPRNEMVRDAGIMFHVTGDPEIWPNSLELQIQEGDTGDAWIVGMQASSTVQNTIRNYAPNGSVETRGSTEERRFARFHRSYMWERPGWNKVEIIVRGARSTFIVNGQVVNALFNARQQDETGAWVPVTAGRILIQAEGAEVFYRNIRIASLADNPPKTTP